MYTDEELYQLKAVHRVISRVRRAVALNEVFDMISQPNLKPRVADDLRLLVGTWERKDVRGKDLCSCEGLALRLGFHIERIESAAL